MSDGKERGKKPVVVLGSGFAGTRAALDLAETGVQVYLLDRNYSPGGFLTSLEKMFPDNTCGACKAMTGGLATGCQRQQSDVTSHPNIEFMGGVQMHDLSGAAGEFRVGLSIQPKYIDPEKCTGCGQCIEVCPAGAPAGHSVYPVKSLYPQASQPLYLEKGVPSPCSEVCPIGINVPGFVHLVRAGRFLEAWQLIYAVNPFPSLCGDRCGQHCALSCNTGGGEAVDIPALVRFVTDYVYNNVYPDLPLPEIKPHRKERVAVIGSGPAGLTAAYALAQRGYPVTVLEISSSPGGLLRSKVSPHLGEMMDKEISLLRRLGVEICTKVSLGASLPVEYFLYCGYQAVLIATLSRITSIARIWEKVSSGSSVLSSYQVTISEKEKTSLLTRLVEEPSIFNFDLPGIFAIRSLAFGLVHADIAVRAGHMAAESIAGYLSTRKDVREVIPLKNWQVPVHKKTAGQVIPLPGLKDAGGPPILTAGEAIEEAGRCLNCGGGCVECGLCVETCPAGAIDLAAKPETLELEAGALILAPGGELYDATLLENYGHGIFPNVVTGLEYEKLIGLARTDFAAPGRPSDGRLPARVAWIQCAGSRDTRHLEYCSSVCCQAALKEAVMTRQMIPGVEAVIFGMDLRPFSRNGEEYLQEALANGVRFERTRIYNLEKTILDNLLIRYAREDGSIQEEEFDLVILSTGIKPAAAGALPEQLKLDPYGFCVNRPGEPCRSTVEGIYSAGVFNGPKDIGSSVAEARAAAIGALAGLGGPLLRPEREGIRFDPDEPARTGVFICSCRGTMEEVLPTDNLAIKSKGIPTVECAVKIDLACRPEGQAEMRKAIKRFALNRVVLAGCTPRLRQREILEGLEEAGIGPDQVERVNIREQVAWVHRDEKAMALIKAGDLIRAGVRRASLQDNSLLPADVVNSDLLVVGTSAAALSAAGAASALGIRVYLAAGADPAEIATRTLSGGAAELFEQIAPNPLVEILTTARVRAVSGLPGNLRVTISTTAGEKTIACGAAVIAGETIVKVESALFSGIPVVTVDELAQKTPTRKTGELETVVVMPGPVPGSPHGLGLYSRECHARALDAALAFSGRNPAARVYFLFKDDLRVYGKDEESYRIARQKGIVFIRYRDDNAPCLTEVGNKFQIEVTDPILGEKVIIFPDLITISPAFLPDPNNRALAGLFGIEMQEDGFFRPLDPKYHPVDSTAEGVFICGPAMGPVSWEEEIVQGRAAAMGALGFLIREFPQINRHVAIVTSKRCSGCALCVKACPAGARSIDPETRVAVVNQALCRGCGACQAACRNAATQQVNFSKKQILEVIDELLN